MALERVGADGSGSQSSRRSCGAPGTSGQCQARGMDPAAGGKSILPSPAPLSFPRLVASLGQGMKEALPHSSFGGCLLEGYGRERHRKIQAPFLRLWGGVTATMPLTLNRGKDIPHLSFSPVKWRLRKTHSLLCPSHSSWDLPWESGQWGGNLLFFQREEPATVRAPVPRSGAGTYVLGCALREMPTEVFLSCWLCC